MRRSTTVLAAAVLGAGVLLTSAVASAAPPVPRDPKWSADHLIDARAAGYDSYVGNRSLQYAAMNSSGDAVASYIKHGHGFDSHAFVVTRDAGGAWSQPTALGHLNSHVVQVGIDAGGRAVAVWNAARNGHLGVYWMQRPARGAWSKPALVPGIPAHAAYEPALAMSPSGVLAIGYDVSGRVYVKVKPGRGAWQPSVAISAVPSGSGAGGGDVAGSQDIALSVSPDGAVSAMWGWIAHVHGTVSLQAGGVGSDGKREPVFRVAGPAAADDLVDVQVATSPSGRTSAFWDDGHPGLVVFRVDDGAWHTYSLPRSTGAQVSSEKLGVTPRGVTAWWTVSDDEGTTAFRSTHHEGAWSPAAAVAHSSRPLGLAVDAAGQSSAGTVFALRRTASIQGSNRIQSQTVVRTHLGGLDDVYRFPSVMLGPNQTPPQVDQLEVSGGKAVMLWSGQPASNTISPLYARSTSDAR